MKGCTLPDREIGEVHIRTFKHTKAPKLFASHELKGLSFLGQVGE